LKKPFIIILFITSIILIAVFVKLKFYDTISKNGNAQKEIKGSINKNALMDGDLIFQTSTSEQSKAIQAATHSKYSHCGIIYKEANDFYVFEAVQPVKITTLDKWIARGEKGKYVIKRLKDAEKLLTPTAIQKIKKIGEEYNGKNYDVTFEWSDDKIYCSELIWKVYKRAIGLELGKLQKLKDFDLTAKVVQQKMTERYGTKIPLDETVISPSSIFDSELLEIVEINE
jgi:uncharacterized protein YycO